MKIDADVKGKLKLVYGSVGSIDSDSDFETEQETLSDQEEHEGLLRGHHRYLPANKKILKRSNGNSLIGHPMNKKSRIDDEAPPPEKNIRTFDIASQCHNRALYQFT
ncbi:tRNA (cmo5U34)-methyltransferase [Striga asiatica]|uniref:tRNA (Cmo5U34)-methyltransferase n=1 Tax=Striga asiatica TaxID=4170 RepID=A0A5A7QYN4_STRAF|nr:tRNA (cmo5U34)-methyltransferase [Striga asiatica]